MASTQGRVGRGTPTGGRYTAGPGAAAVAAEPPEVRVTDGNPKGRESRLRREADRQGLALRKSRQRDVDAPDYGLYAILDAKTGFPMHSGSVVNTPYSLTLDEVDEWLTAEGP